MITLFDSKSTIYLLVNLVLLYFCLAKSINFYLSQRCQIIQLISNTLGKEYEIILGELGMKRVTFVGNTVGKN